jgi:hypothetical protein
MFFEYASEFSARNPNLERDFEEFRRGFVVTSRILAEFRRMVKKKGKKINEGDFQKDLPYIKSQIKREIARQIWGNEAYHYVRVDNDNQVQEAIMLFDRAARIARLDMKR